MESRSDAVVARRSTVRSASVASSSLAGAGGTVTRARSRAGRIAAWGARSIAARIGVASNEGMGDETHTMSTRH
eukprot:438115-Pleurochrysis_carterae.AAC.1